MDHSVNTKFSFPKQSRLAKRFAVCLFLILTGCGTEEPQHYIEEGKALFEKGDLESARVQFQNALQLDPKLADAYFRLALLDEKKEDWGGMLGNILETVAIDPKHLDGQLKLGQIFLSGGQLDKAAEQVKISLQLSPENPTALLMEASIQFRQGKKIEAMQGVERVLAKQPYLADAMGLKATILAADKQNDDAVAALKLGIEQHPDDVDLRLLKIRLEIDSKDFDEAVHDYEALIAQHPEDVGLRSSLANLLNELGRFDQAESTLREAINIYPAETELKLKLVELIGLRNGEQAEKTLKDFIAQSPKDAQLKFRLADYYVARQHLADAEVILQEIAAANEAGKDGVAAKVKLAQIALLQKNTTKVERLAEEVLNVDANNSDALFLRAGMRLNKNDADGAISDLRIVLRDRPNFEQAMILMAQASLLKGETEVAESQWRKVLEINPNNMAAMMPLAIELLKRGDYARAEEISTKAAKANNNAPAPFELLIQLKAARKDWVGARTTVDQLKRIPQAVNAAKYWEGYLAAQQGRTNEAIKDYQDVLAVQPDHLQSLVALTQLYESSGHRSDLIAYLKSFTAKNPGVTEAVDILASAYIAEKHWEDAEKTLRTASENTPDDIDLKLKLVDVIERQSESRAESTLKEFIQAQPDQVRLKFRIAAHYADLKRYPEATALLKEVVSSDAFGKEGLSAKLKLAELAWVQNDSAMAKTLLEEVILKEPRNYEALMMRASIRMAEKDINAALDDLNRVLENRPDFERALLMMAQAYELQGAMDKAEETWRRILKIQPSNLAALLPLTNQLMTRREWAQAEEIVGKAVKYNPGNSQILELNIQLRFAKKDWLGAQEAITALKKLPQAELAARMWAASLAMNQEQHDEAIQLYKEVLNKNPNVPGALLSLAQAYQKTGHQRELIAYLKSLLQKNPNLDVAYQVLAMAYATEKNWLEAEKLLQEKLKRNPKDALAYALLARLYADQGKDAEVEMTYRNGLSALGDNLQLMVERAKFYVVKRDFGKAIDAYQEIVNEFPENDEAANNLADLLVTHQADDKESIARALALVERFKDSPNAAVQDTYGWVHLKSGDLEKALPALKRAVEVAPKDAAVRYHLGAAYQQHGDTSAAISELEKSLALAQEQGVFFEIERAKALLKQLQNN